MSLSPEIAAHALLPGDSVTEINLGSTIPPAGTQEVMTEMDDKVLGVVTTFNMDPQDDSLVLPWAKAIRRHFQRPYSRTATLAARMTGITGAWIAFPYSRPQEPLAFAMLNPDENIDVTNFEEFGVVWPKVGKGEASQRYIRGATGILWTLIREKSDNHLVMVKSYAGDSRSSSFFHELGMDYAPLVSRQDGVQGLFISNAERMRRRMQDYHGFPIERYVPEPIYNES